MITMKFVKLSRTSAWVAVGAALVGLIAAVVHPDAPKVSISTFIADSVLGDIAEYLTYAVGFFALFWFGLHRWMAARQLSRRRWPKLSQLSRELLFSLCSQFIMLGVGTWIAFGDNAVAANVYVDIGEYGWAYFGFLTFVLFAVDDTVFYWSHRAMHHPKLFEAFHRVHHESTDPTPFTAYSFHPLEAIVLTIGPLALTPVLMFLPWHPAAIIIYSFGNILFNVIGHLGYEIYPSRWNRIPLLRWKTPAMHHYLHHQMVGGNYSLYFRWWDKICGTEFKDFEARYDRLFAAASPQSSPDLDMISTHQRETSNAQNTEKDYYHA